MDHREGAGGGRRTDKVDPRTTSQQCSACGDGGERKHLRVRRWICRVCGTRHDRDVNAARNIKQRFNAHSGPCRPGVRGEEAAGESSERSSTNREGATAPRREQRATRQIDQERFHETFRQAPLDFGESDGR
ncbi:MAG TPA: transposase [Herpetosiphonaceae bacterium]